MGMCKHCNQDAGFLRSRHKECQDAYDVGWRSMVAASKHTAVYDQGNLEHLEPVLQRIASASYIGPTGTRQALIAGWESAVDEVLDDHLLTESEERNLVAYADRFRLQPDELDGTGAATRAYQAIALRKLHQGTFRPVPGLVDITPFNLLKSETLYWVFHNVAYYLEKVERERVGRRQGVSVRVVSGVYYNTGTFRSHTVERLVTRHVDTGILGVTDKHIYFSGDHEKFRVRYDRIVTFDAYADGIGIMREAASAKPQTFKTGDGWFIYNLVTTLAQEGS